jgi:hypothetical protein
VTRKNDKTRQLTPEIRRALLHPTLIGPDHVFSSEEDRKRAWVEFRDVIMAIPRNPCTRPDVWWCFEAPEKPWAGESQRQALARLNLLTDEEISSLKEWGQWPVEPCPGPRWDPREILR